jgi:hypothetical protein
VVLTLILIFVRYFIPQSRDIVQFKKDHIDKQSGLVRGLFHCMKLNWHGNLRKRKKTIDSPLLKMNSQTNKNKKLLLDQLSLQTLHSPGLN